MIVSIKVVEDGRSATLIGQVDNRVYPPVQMPKTMTRFEVELEGIRRFLRRHQNHYYVSFVVDPYLADVLSYRRNPSCSTIDMGVNRIWYLVKRRPGPVHFRGRADA
ncbi:MAG: hypothetical protein HS104_24950 [Polyangiaceae bacterium]|nr:hypothetical protein [Polyangiaceae bacterium]MCL4756690.1 hypothetical protein [Myxococcales bacterium]